MNEKPKWKLIDSPEGKPGDQYFHQEWNTVTEGMNLSGLIVRRQMTPAEVNAEELTQALRNAMHYVWMWDEAFEDLEADTWPASYWEVKATWDKLFK